MCLFTFFTVIQAINSTFGIISSSLYCHLVFEIVVVHPLNGNLQNYAIHTHRASGHLAVYESVCLCLYI